MQEKLRRVLNVITDRMFIKTAFFLFFVFCVIQLFRFEAWARGEGAFVDRPEAVAGILPVGHFTSFFGMLRGAGWDTVLPAGLVIIIGALAVSLLFKRGFCGYICPVGTFWEYAALIGRKIFGHNFKMPKWLDNIGRGFQILITVAAVALLMSVSLAEVLDFRKMPYMAIADLKIMHEFAHPVFLIAIIVCLGISLFLSPLWCRYLCPVGGLYALVGLASPCKVHRDEDACIHCGKCAHACHTLIDPSKVKTVNSTVCDGCMDCVKVCPVEDCLEAKAFGRVKIAPWMWAAGVVVLWLLIYFIARALGAWHTSISPETFKQYINMGILESTTKGFL